jgi:hypothetical protein
MHSKGGSIVKLFTHLLARRRYILASSTWQEGILVFLGGASENADGAKSSSPNTIGV